MFFIPLLLLCPCFCGYVHIWLETNESNFLFWFSWPPLHFNITKIWRLELLLIDQIFLKCWTLTLVLELKRDLWKRWMGRWEVMSRGPSLLTNSKYPDSFSSQGERSQMGTDWIHLVSPFFWIKQTISTSQVIPEQEGRVNNSYFNSICEKASSGIHSHTIYSATVSKHIDQ